MYKFFLSYARQDRDRYMTRFLRDLSNLVRGQAGLSEGEDVCFFDGKDIEPGEEWTEKLGDALKTSQTMLALCSPVYFQRQYCGREWQVFAERIDALAQVLPEGSPRPPLIIPVRWYPVVHRHLPPQVGTLQDHYDDLGEVYGREGLQYLLRQKGRHRAEYEEFLTRLATLIITRGNTYSLPLLTTLRPLTAIPSLFHSLAVPRTPGPRNETLGPRVAQFVFMAGRRNELGTVRRSVEFYGAEGGRDWRPYLPDDSRDIGILAQDAAAAEEFHYEVLTIDQMLIDRIEDAKRKNKVVVVVLDAWTLRVERYFTLMRNYDDRTFLNSAVLVLWNPADAELPAAEGQLRLRLEAALASRFTARDSQVFRDPVSSAEEFRVNLRDVLHQASARIRRTAEIFRRIEVDFVIPKPTLFGV